MKTMKKTRRGKIALAILAFALMGAGVWAKPKSVATYKFTRSVYSTQGNTERATETIDFYFLNGELRLKINDITQTERYVIGYKTNKVWKLYIDNSWQDSDTPVSKENKKILQAIIDLRDSQKDSTLITCQSVFGDKSNRAFCEVSISDCFLTRNFAFSSNYGNALPTGGFLPEKLPDLSDSNPDFDNENGEIVIGLKKTSGKTLGVVFKRAGGVFAGETRLFNASTTQTLSYVSKSLSFMRMYLSVHGASDFQDYLCKLDTQLKSANWNVSLPMVTEGERRQYYESFATMMQNGITNDWKQTVNSKSVFGNPNGVDILDRLYGCSRFPYSQYYLMYLWGKSRPVFASKIRSENSALYNPENYEQISADNGKKIAQAAMRYYTWGVEYVNKNATNSMLTAYGNENRYEGVRKTNWLEIGSSTNNTADYFSGQLKQGAVPIATDDKSLIFDFSHVSSDLWLIPFSDGKIGYPLPYARYGIDTPRTFAWKMDIALKTWNLKNSPKSLQTTALTGEPVNSFTAGGSSGKLSEAGIDAMGLLTGCIAQTDFYDRVISLSGSSPATKLKEYAGFIASGPYSDGTGVPKFATTIKSRINPYTLLEEDLEKCSVVLPDLSLIQLGDIIVNFGISKGFPTTLGIVVGFDEDKKPKFGEDQREFIKTIQVVSVREAMGQVTLSRWGNNYNVFNGFTEDERKFHVRRLLVRKQNTADFEYAAKEWDICDKDSVTLVAKIESMHEMDYTGNTDVKERWIPNTGEYLLLSKVVLSPRSDCGAKVNYTGKNDDLEIYVAGAVDRGYTTAIVNQGNIYNNTADSRFDIALIRQGSSEGEIPDIVRIGFLQNSGDGKYSFTPYDKVLYNLLGINKHILLKDFKNNRIWRNSDNGQIEGFINGVGGYVLGIRPQSISSAMPGDDLLLQFGIRRKGEAVATPFQVGNKTRQLVSSVEADDYLAVYDKKMLWRANLYINETADAPFLGTEGVRENVDWNITHPWAVPHTGNAGAPAWWSVEWGNNQWNRTYRIANNDYDADLEFGEPSVHESGRQLLTFADFPYTPIRPKSNAGQATNFHNNTIAYDYPDDDKDIRAWDSPFDFIYKMHEQRRALRNAFQQYLDPQTANGELPANVNDNAVFPNGIDGNIAQPNPQATKLAMARQATTTATHNQWKFYWKEPTPNVTHAYLPGLGFRYYAHGDYEAGTAPGVNLEFTDKASAGADCIGFAQRAASYEKNQYSWTNPGNSGGIPKDRAEGNENPDNEPRYSPLVKTAQPLAYSVSIITRESMPGLPDLVSNDYFTTIKGKELGPAKEVFDKQIRPQFLKIVPGDVIGYSGHAGIVCKVDTVAMMEATSIYDLMRAVVVIESVYSTKLNHVFKRNMLQGAGEAFNEDSSNGTKSWHLDELDGNGIMKFRKWYIGRLLP